MSDSIPQRSVGDHVHLATRVALSAIPGIGGPALELFNAAIAQPIEQRKNAWLNDLAQRLDTLEREKRLKIEDLGKSDEFISAVMQASSAAIRTHHQEKLDALRNAVLNSALGQCPTDVNSAMFLAFVDQFTVWHLRILKELSEHESPQGMNRTPKTSIAEITEVAVKRIAELQGQKALAEIVVEDLCRKGLLFWNGGRGGIYIPNGTSQITPLGQEFLAYVSNPKASVSG